MSAELEMIQQIWIRFVPQRGQFGIKATNYYGEETVVYADDVDLGIIFPAKPRPGISNIKIDTQGVTIALRQPFVISGTMQAGSEGKSTLKLTLHHEK